MEVGRGLLKQKQAHGGRERYMLVKIGIEGRERGMRGMYKVERGI